MIRFQTAMSCAFIAAALAACAASTGSGAASSPSERNGVFRFTERVAETSVRLEGTITVTADTIALEMNPGPCRREPQETTVTRVVFTCGDVRLTVDRDNPSERTSYSLVTMKTVSERVCVRYEQSSNGVRTCVEYRTEIEEVPVRRSGRLRTVRIAGPPTPRTPGVQRGS